MRTQWKQCLGIVAVVASALSASAQPEPIVVEVNGTPVDTVVDGGNVDINIGTVTGNVLVRIYDDDANGGTPANSVGSVTIRGSAGTSGTPILRVLVAGEGETGFPPTPTSPIEDAGVRDFGGGTSGGLIIVDNDSNPPNLRDVTRLAMAVSGDVTGTIDVGQVFRLQALGRGSAGTYAGGNIDANITARTWDDNNDVTDFFNVAIGFIGAGNAITGEVVATGAIESGTGNILAGSIDQIRVGAEANNDGGSPSSPAAAGITGHIRAETGEIATIYTEGPIGSASQESEIWAGNGIRELRAIRFTDDEAVLASNFQADVQTNLRTDLGRAFSDSLAPTDRFIHLIETAGSYTGSIVTENLTAPSYTGGGATFGIFVGGTLDGTVDIKDRCLAASIMADTFTQPIRIGTYLKGSIVARNGTIPDLSVGAAPHPEEVLYFGFRGSTCEPPDHRDLSATGCSSAGEPDSLIAADHIGTLYLSRMSLSNKHWVPRVEAPIIDRLTIDDMREGVVWSGLLEFDPSNPGFVQNNPDNDYADIEVLKIGCLGPFADVWYQDEFAHFDFVFGEIHVPALPAGHTIYIAGELGAGALACSGGGGIGEGEGGLNCGCDYNPALQLEPPLQPNLMEEDSPRWTVWPDEFDQGTGATRDAGAVRILEPKALAGQIIINGKNELPDGDGWDGIVLIHDGTALTPPDDDPMDPDDDQIILGPAALASASQFEGPHYEAESEVLGGGAVGVVRYDMHGFDSEPSYDGVGPELRFSSDFAHTSNAPQHWFDIEIEHYGPILATNISSPVLIEVNTASGWVELMPGLFTFQTWMQDSTLSPRTLRIKTNMGKIHGYLRITPRSSLLCWDTSSYPAVTPYEYQIVLMPDCDNDRINDEGDPDLSTCVDCSCNLVHDDEPPPVVDVFDLLFYLDCWFVQDLCAEWDNVSGIDVFDLLAYLDCWFPASARPEGCPD